MIQPLRWEEHGAYTALLVITVCDPSWSCLRFCWDGSTRKGGNIQSECEDEDIEYDAAMADVVCQSGKILSARRGSRALGPRLFIVLRVVWWIDLEDNGERRSASCSYLHIELEMWNCYS